MSGSHLSGLSRGCFSQVKSEKWQHICQGSLSFPQFCLTTAKNLKWWMDQCWLVLQLSFIWQAKENTSSRCRGMQTQRNKEKRGTWLNFGSSFYMFFLLPLSLPCVNWASQEGCLFYLRFSLLTLYLPLFCFWRAFPFLCFLATAIMDSLFLFQLPNIVIPDKITVQKWAFKLVSLDGWVMPQQMSDTLKFVVFWRLLLPHHKSQVWAAWLSSRYPALSDVRSLAWTGPFH